MDELIIPFTLADTLQFLKGATISVVPGTNFSQRVAEGEGRQPQPPAMTFEPVSVVNAGDDGNGGFFVEVKRNPGNTLDNPSTFIFTADNGNVFNVKGGASAVMKDGQAFDLYPDVEAPESDATGTVKANGKTYKVGSAGTVLITVFFVIGLAATLRFLFKAITNKSTGV